jgi:hypothetical protein
MLLDEGDNKWRKITSVIKRSRSHNIARKNQKKVTKERRGDDEGSRDTPARRRPARPRLEAPLHFFLQPGLQRQRIVQSRPRRLLLLLLVVNWGPARERGGGRGGPGGGGGGGCAPQGGALGGEGRRQLSPAVETGKADGPGREAAAGGGAGDAGVAARGPRVREEEEGRCRGKRGGRDEEEWSRKMSENGPRSWSAPCLVLLLSYSLDVIYQPDACGVD